MDSLPPIIYIYFFSVCLQMCCSYRKDFSTKTKVIQISQSGTLPPEKKLFAREVNI